MHEKFGLEMCIYQLRQTQGWRTFLAKKKNTKLCVNSSTMSIGLVKIKMLFPIEVIYKTSFFVENFFGVCVCCLIHLNAKLWCAFTALISIHVNDQCFSQDKNLIWVTTHYTPEKKKLIHSPSFQFGMLAVASLTIFTKVTYKWKEKPH